MGKTHSVPRNVKGESRILIIFTVKSFLFTVAFLLVGYIFASLFSMLGFGMGAWVIMFIFGAIGYALGSLTIPDSPVVGKLRKAGGEQLANILFRTFTFGKRKKIYLYRLGGKE